jgi:hypothetical protein
MASTNDAARAGQARQSEAITAMQNLRKTAQELAKARRAKSEDPAVTVALRFASVVMRSVGHDRALADVRAAAYDAAIMEIVATVFINVVTNAVNHVAGTIPDETDGTCGLTTKGRKARARKNAR